MIKCLMVFVLVASFPAVALVAQQGGRASLAVTPLPQNFEFRRIAFDQKGFLYLRVGERQEQDRAQKGDDHGGKVLRLRDDCGAED